MRPYGVTLFIAGYESDKPLLYKVDPTGTCLGIRGFAAGHKSNDLND